MQGSGFGSSQQGNVSNASSVFTDGSTTSKAANYGTWSDSSVICQVPDNVPVRSLTVRGSLSIFIVPAFNGNGSLNPPGTGGNPYTFPADATPNPTPLSSPPGLSPTPSPTPTMPSPTPSPTVPSPGPSPSTDPGGGVPAPPFKLAFVVQPANSVIASAVPPAVTVEVQTASGQRVAGAACSVTLEIGANPGGAVLSGTLTATAVHGVATFSNLSLDRAGTGYILKATSGNLAPAASETFNIGGFGLEYVASQCFDTGAAPEAMAGGDFNGDGKPDLAGAYDNSVDVFILLGKGDGTFGTPVSYPAGSGASSVVTGDFDGDGKPDLTVVSLYSGTYILQGNGDGTFSPPVKYAARPEPVSAAVGDFNGDRRPDIVAVNYEGVTIYLHR